MTSESAVYRSHGDAAVDDSNEAASGTFPAGSSVIALTAWFVLSRALSHMTARSPSLLKVATFTGVAGAILAMAALFGSLGTATLNDRGSLRILQGFRTLAVLPLALVLSATLFVEPRVELQWAALFSVAVTVLLSCALGMLRKGSSIAGRFTFATLLIGSLVELSYAPAQAMLTPGGPGAIRMAWLGRVAEVCTFAGAIACAVWSFGASKKLVGAARTRLFLPFTVAIASVMGGLVAVLPANVATYVGRTAFGARFDWALSGADTAVSKLVLFGYLLAPVSLLSAIGLSMASVGFDRGAGSRRVFALFLLLFSGFGVLRLAGPMDPIRLVTVALAAVLLERSQWRENAPAV